MNNNTYLFTCLLALIVINIFWCYYNKHQREGFSMDDLNPVKLIDKVLGKMVDGLLGSVPILDFIHKKVKKEDGLFKKIGLTFWELFLALMTIIFLPMAAILVLYLVFLFCTSVLVPLMMRFFTTPIHYRI